MQHSPVVPNIISSRSAVRPSLPKSAPCVGGMCAGQRLWLVALVKLERNYHVFLQNLRNAGVRTEGWLRSTQNRSVSKFLSTKSLAAACKHTYCTCNLPWGDCGAPDITQVSVRLHKIFSSALGVLSQRVCVLNIKPLLAVSMTFTRLSHVQHSRCHLWSGFLKYGKPSRLLPPPVVEKPRHKMFTMLDS